MNMEFSDADLAFRDEVRAFIKEKFTDKLKTGAARTPGVFVEPDLALEWHQALNDKGWVAYSWPEEYGGTNWTPTQRYLFEKELSASGAFLPSPISMKLIGPVICEYGTE